MAASNYGPHSYDSLRKAMNKTTASERERFEAWALPILGDSPTWRESGPCELAWQAWQARAALPAPADQPPEPQGSSGSLSEGGVEARTQDAASAFERRQRDAFNKIHPINDEVPGALREAFFELFRQGWAGASDYYGIVVDGFGPPDKRGYIERIRPNADAAMTTASQEAREYPPLPEPKLRGPLPPATNIHGAFYTAEQVYAYIDADRKARQQEARKPDGYAYRYPDGLRFNNGGEVNGSKPTEAVPYWLASAPQASQPTQGAASPLTDDSAAGSNFEQELRSGGRWSPEMIERVAGAEPAIFNAISAYTPPGTHSATASPLPAPQEPADWADQVEQRLLTWRQRFVNKSGDQLALDDFMGQESIDDLIDFVCAPLYAAPAPDSTP